MRKVIFITGAGRGLGTDIAREALATGHQVVATGRRPEEVEKTLGGPQDNLLVTKLDVTSIADAEAAAQAAVDRFGRIDVLINNAGNLFTGYFEEISPAQMRQQFETNLFGPMNVTRAVLPVLRAQRAGHVITITSTAGLTVAQQDKPLQRFVAGADAIEAAEAKAKELLAQAEASRELGAGLAYDDVHA